MAKPRDKAARELLEALAALPEDEGWAITHKLETGPGCSLMGDLKVTPEMVEKLVELRARLDSSSFWLAQVAAAPARPWGEGDSNHDDFI